MKNNYLILNGTILTGEENVLLKNTDLLLVNGKVQALGHKENFELPGDYEVIDATRFLVMPGFTNLHVHLGESIFRGKCDGMDLWEYLDVSHNTYNKGKWKDSEEQIHRLSGLVTMMECLQNGTGSIVCNRGWEEAKEIQIEANCLFPIVNINKLKKYYNDIFAVQKICSQYQKYVRTSLFLQSMYLCEEEKLTHIK